ncbi:MAG TPA: response regulator, partial [Coriobacteriia bacterium]|nr:response regulator [Coriobacteriia bacterium]
MSESAPARVLFVEDVDLMARIYGGRLAAAGLVVDRARTGRDAIGLCAAATYDLLLLDLTLPDMSGLDVLATLRRDTTRSAPPTIVLTNATDPRQRSAARAAGAMGVLV